MIIKWTTTKYAPREITRIECAKETSKTVTIIEMRPNKHGDLIRREEIRRKKTGWWICHDTWKEAHEYLLHRAKIALDDARKELARAQSNHGNIVGMKEPK